MDVAQAPAQATATAQPSSMPSSAPAPGAVSPQMTAPAPASSPSAPAPMAQDSGWAAAQNLISQGLIGTPQYQPQAPFSAPTPQAVPSWEPQPTYAPAPAYHQPATRDWLQQAPIYSPAPQAPTAAPQTHSPPLPQAPVNAEPALDGYLTSISDESIEVLNHFGPEAPALLNRYATTIEEALLAQAEQTVGALQQLETANHVIDESQLVVHGLLEDNEAYQELCTNEDLLADYVNTVMGPGGPFEQILPEDELAADVATFQGTLPGDQLNAPRGNYERPGFEMQPPAGAELVSGDPEDFWEKFRQVRTANPSQAYLMLQQATPEQLTSRALISERAPYES